MSAFNAEISKLDVYEKSRWIQHRGLPEQLLALVQIGFVGVDFRKGCKVERRCLFPGQRMVLEPAGEVPYIDYELSDVPK